MSRAYKIQVSESLKRVLRAEDHVSTQLELLDILPHDEMVGLLAAELERAGFQRQGKDLVRERGGIRVAIEQETATVTVEATATEKVKLTGRETGRAYDDIGPDANKVRADLREKVRGDLEKQAEERGAQLQEKLTDQLEGELIDLRQELDAAVNRATGEALKRKAAQMGRIKELSEDPQSGSLTIVVEV